MFYVFYKVTGRMPFVVKDLHDRHGPIVRTGPNELSFISGQAWRDIYGQQPGLPQNPRDPYSYSDSSNDEFMRHNILMATDRDHARQRSRLGHAFSARALHEQQPLISGHVDHFINELRHRAEMGPQDLTAWFIWITFDIIGDLSFGQSFGCIEGAKHHPWILTIFQSARATTILANLRRFGVNLIKLMPKALLKPRAEMIAFCRDRVDKRISTESTTERKDFISFMLKETKKGDPAMTTQELHANAEILVIAGSETTATLLTGMTFLLLSQRPDWLAKLQKSVRTSFDSDSISHMNFQTVTTRLPLLIATISEALRIYPPVPSGHPRLIKTPDRVIDGKFVPIGTAVVVYQWASNHSSRNWYRPDEFLPERWLSELETHDPELAKAFARDKKDSMSPFSLGVRRCLGQRYV